MFQWRMCPNVDYLKLMMKILIIKDYVCCISNKYSIQFCLIWLLWMQLEPVASLQPNILSRVSTRSLKIQQIRCDLSVLNQYARMLLKIISITNLKLRVTQNLIPYLIFYLFNDIIKKSALSHPNRFKNVCSLEVIKQF